VLDKKNSEVRAFTVPFIFCQGLVEDLFGIQSGVFFRRWVGYRIITRRFYMSVASVQYSTVTPIPVSGDLRAQAARQLEIKPENKVKPQVIHSTASDVQMISHALNRKLQFVVDQTSNQVIVKVIDKDTDKVIKELPPEELQRLHSNLKKAIGVLFDQMV